VLNPNIRTILLKGEPGTGKTIFSCELARIQGKAIYVSLTNAGEVAHNPLLRDLIAQGKVVQIPYGGENDTKIDDPSFGSLDALLESLAQTADRMSGSLIVFDSWDEALLSRKSEITPMKIERSLLRIADQSDSKLLFLEEESGTKPSDYLFDAIVVLRSESVSGRTIRRAEIRKLSGSPIVQRSFLFSLHQGRFQLFQTTSGRGPRRYEIRFFIPKKHLDSRYSTGSQDFDDYLRGGLRESSTALIEFGSHLQTDVFQPMFSSLVCNFLANGGCSVAIPSSDTLPEAVVDGINPYLPPSVVESFFRIGSCDLRNHPNLFPLDPNSLTKTREIFWEQAEQMKGNDRRPCLWFVGLDTLEFLYGTDGLARFALMLSQRSKNYGDALVFTAKRGTQCGAQISDLCDIHFKLDEIDGALITYSIRPKTGINKIDYSYSSGYPQVKLIPIV
jgi:KaiC/GvpD/RAD55 family RecA-like ATPase